MITFLRISPDIFVKISVSVPQTLSIFDLDSPSRLIKAIAGLAFLCYTTYGEARKIQEPAGLIEALTEKDINAAAWLQDVRLSLGGWVAAGGNL
jgi:hypothetical protein